MKLDKIKFAKLIALIATNYNYISDDFIIELNDFLDIPEPEQLKVPCKQIDELLRVVIAEDGFIEAIKAYRALTGAGLEESKDAIKRYRKMPKLRITAKQMQQKMLDIIAFQVNNPNARDYLLNSEELGRVANFINSFDDGE